MEAPKLKAFVVSTQWGTGYGSLDIRLEYAPEMAAAMVVADVLRSETPPTDNLTNLTVREIPVATLRAMLQKLETGKSATVVSLVPKPEVSPAQEAAVQATQPLCP